MSVSLTKPFPLDAAIRLYSEGCGSSLIGKQLGFNENRILRQLRRHGVKIRTPSEATKLTYLSGTREYKSRNGKYVDSYGYVQVREPNNPRAHKGFVKEHVLIWERVHNKPLPKDWVIHHLNGIKTDNRPRNLLAMPAKSHHSSMVLLETKKRLRETEAEIELLTKALANNQLIFTSGEN